MARQKKEPIYRPAPIIEEIAIELISTYHQDLCEASILYTLTNQKAACAPILCSPKLRFALSRHMPGALTDDGLTIPEVANGPDFWLIVNELEWDLKVIEGKEKSWIDHRLEHIVCQRDNEDQSIHWKLKPHWFNEHRETVERWGVYDEQTEVLREIFQPELD